MHQHGPRRQRAASDPRLPMPENKRLADLIASLPQNDSDPNALQQLLEANREFRHVEWPEPFNRTSHTIHVGDARELGFIPDESVHLIVTSPPYWTLKEYN